MGFKLNTYYLIDGKGGNHKSDAYVDVFVSVLIVLNIVSIFLESFDEIRNDYGAFFSAFEVFSIIIFSIEYILRLWTADILYPESSKLVARLKFIFSFMGMIDLLAILPFFLPLIITTDLRIIRSLRLVRLFRIFKLGRHSKSLRMVGDVFRETKYDLLVTLFITGILLVIASTMMYYLEHDDQPEAFPNMGQSLWWAIATLTTVGYGDIYPITAMGKILSGVIALIGVGVVALPTGIISSAFVVKLDQRNKERKREKVTCPSCGKVH